MAAWSAFTRHRPGQGARVGRDGGTINPSRFMVGPLAYLLKNRFYIGEAVYRGEVHPGEQQPIIDKELFEAVQRNSRIGGRLCSSLLF
jgi:hypothetical protein